MSADELKRCEEFAKAHAGQRVVVTDGVYSTKAYLWGYLETALGNAGVVVQPEVPNHKVWQPMGVTNQGRIRFTTALVPLDKSEMVAVWMRNVQAIECAVPAGPDPSKFPHVCPKCGSPAYIGFNSTECSKAGCNP